MAGIDFTAFLDYLDEQNISTANETWITCVNGSDCLTWEIYHCMQNVNKNAILYIISFFYILIFISGLGANIIVVYVNVKSIHSRHETHFYILNLAIADLCVVITLPIWVTSFIQHGTWPFGVFMCKFTHLIFSVNLFGSIFFLTCMSVDRYVSVMWFQDSVDRKKVLIRKVICVFIWIFALLVSVPDLIFLKVNSNHQGAPICHLSYPEDNFREWMAGMEICCIIIGFLIPFLVIAVFYFLLATAIPIANDPERKNSRKIIFVYVIVFLICWFPYHSILFLDVLWFLDLLSFSCQLENFIIISLHITQCLSLIHCCVNPILYSFINKNYRYDLMKAFIVKYSVKSGIMKLMDTTETECCILECS
ncbi:atypical chemokine receptor 3-like [Pristis pectinata]|uniref:atypical chemokine receptor 3-like n=1 Tax=Pristis pectinata TaxID=685728 RepID=UPI00223E7A6A|nr:atypical chemokine receptor 3-like [Pristis pectinata]